MIRGPLGSRASIGGPLGSGRGGAAAWYLAGGVSAANCVAAYQPKGAADYATSKVNLANPGTYNATDGTAYPTWAAATGWTFTGVSSQYLYTGIIPTNNQTWSGIAYFTVGGTAGTPFAAAGNSGGATPYFGVEPNNAGVNRRYFAGFIVTVTPPLTGTHSMAVAGNQGYLDGSPDGGAIATAGTSFNQIAIGRLGVYSGFYFTGNIAAIAIYNATLTATQISLISAAMAAL